MKKRKRQEEWLSYAFMYHFSGCFHYDTYIEKEGEDTYTSTESETAVNEFYDYESLISRSDSDVMEYYAESLSDIIVGMGFDPDDYQVCFYMADEHNACLYADFYFSDETDMLNHLPVFTVQFSNFQAECKTSHIYYFLNGIQGACNSYSHTKEITQLDFRCHDFKPEDRDALVADLIECLCGILQDISEDNRYMLFRHFYVNDRIELSFDEEWNLKYRFFDYYGRLSGKDRENFKTIKFEHTSQKVFRLTFDEWEIKIRLKTSSPSAKKQTVEFLWRFTKTPEIPVYTIKLPSADDTDDNDDGSSTDPGVL